MKKSIEIRKIIFDILIEIYKKNKNFDDLFNLKTTTYNLNDQDKSFVFNVCLNTMRHSIHSKKILNKFVKKKLKTNQYILLSSAIVQIVFLNIKPYAVVNETVEIAKKIDLYPSFINAVLKNIVKEIEDLKKIRVEIIDLPLWFQEEAKVSKNINIKSFLETYFFVPDLHIVFKSSSMVNDFKENLELSSETSAFVKSNKKVVALDNYKDGKWWVQNFSSMIPIMIGSNLKNKTILDLCAAPGGKAFQIISKNNNIILNDISKKRIKILKENLSRLNFSAKIENYDALKFPENKKFDIILLDSPCSAIGTIRKNPEILFRKDKPDLKSLIELQENLILKASKLLEPKGIIIYMVCSFFFSETVNQIDKFLEKNKDFRILKYENMTKDIDIQNFISNDGFFLTTPSTYKGFTIDGFFSVQLIKNA